MTLATPWFRGSLRTRKDAEAHRQRVAYTATPTLQHTPARLPDFSFDVGHGNSQHISGFEDQLTAYLGIATKATTSQAVARYAFFDALATSIKSKLAFSYVRIDDVGVRMFASDPVYTRCPTPLLWLDNVNIQPDKPYLDATVLMSAITGYHHCPEWCQRQSVVFMEAAADAEHGWTRRHGVRPR